MDIRSDFRGIAGIMDALTGWEDASARFAEGSVSGSAQGLDV
jgi:hypothetical protein